MSTKPARAVDYLPGSLELVKSAALYVATKLGDLSEDVVLIGGLAPSFLVPQTPQLAPRSLHIGTMDVDLGLAVAIFDAQRYHDLCERLRAAGFAPDLNEQGKTVNQRWRIETEKQWVMVDFLIPPTRPDDRGGKLRNLEAGFAAIIMPGLELAFLDNRLVTLAGETIRHEQATRNIWVCEAGAFLVLKALAFQNRGENKDAYDLMYILQNYGADVGDVFQRLRPLLNSHYVHQALRILEQDFTALDAVGTKRFAEFLGDLANDEWCADAAAAARSLLRMCREAGWNG